MTDAASLDGKKDLVRQRLAGLREQRREQRVTAEQLALRIRATVADATQAGVSMTEIARLLDMDRSSVYRTYVEIPVRR